jgi:hypothetical protein
MAPVVRHRTAHLKAKKRGYNVDAKPEDQVLEPIVSRFEPCIAHGPLWSENRVYLI